MTISSAQVSRATALLDEELSAWRDRPLGRCPFLFLDTHYEKVRQSGRVRDVAVLLDVGMKAGQTGGLGRFGLVGWARSALASVHEVFTEPELRGVELVISDDHLGLKAARQAAFGGVPWQRC